MHLKIGPRNGHAQSEHNTDIGFKMGPRIGTQNRRVGIQSGVQNWTPNWNASETEEDPKKEQPAIRGTAGPERRGGTLGRGKPLPEGIGESKYFP